MVAAVSGTTITLACVALAAVSAALIWLLLSR
jgi:hypothetical protein